ncbi:hypothetical protein BU16DRAFT_82573 [Lophium mytilinum]|uniref:Uncharacterized protein n=1 Tax=Lophium mytilinum TaxID=390894 RepID=A0A6A6QN68_9PEZI|nr:hypothetical protein BU16DRAFT_82573 [Lophium mytilinum]
MSGIGVLCWVDQRKTQGVVERRDICERLAAVSSVAWRGQTACLGKRGCGWRHGEGSREAGRVEISQDIVINTQYTFGGDTDLRAFEQEHVNNDFIFTGIPQGEAAGSHSLALCYPTMDAISYTNPSVLCKNPSQTPPMQVDIQVLESCRFPNLYKGPRAVTPKVEMEDRP